MIWILDFGLWRSCSMFNWTGSFLSFLDLVFLSINFNFLFIDLTFSLFLFDLIGLFLGSNLVIGQLDRWLALSYIGFMVFWFLRKKNRRTKFNWWWSRSNTDWDKIIESMNPFNQFVLIRFIEHFMFNPLNRWNFSSFFSNYNRFFDWNLSVFDWKTNIPSSVSHLTNKRLFLPKFVTFHFDITSRCQKFIFIPVNFPIHFFDTLLRKQKLNKRLVRLIYHFAT